MNEFIKNQKRSSIILPMMLTISMIMIEQLNLASNYNTTTNIEPTLYGRTTDTTETNFYTLKLTQAPENYHPQSYNFPGKGQKVGGNRTDSNLVPENSYLYKETKDLNEKAARLIEENLRGPKEQAAILFFYQAPFVIDMITRMPVLYTLDGQPIMLNNKQQSLPTVQQILDKINSKFSYEFKEKALQVLKIYLDAIDDAKQVAAIEAYFDANQQNYYFYQTANARLTEILDQTAKKIHLKINTIKNVNNFIPNTEFTYNNINLSNKNHILFSIDNVDKIIKHNDFREKIKNRNNKEELAKAAELLIKECFIAQQHHLKDDIRLQLFDKHDLKKGYIFDSFPDFEHLIAIASQFASKNKLQAANKLFKDISLAVQTALYLAKKESNYYITTDPFVKILYDMHKKVDGYCINPEYGATIEDINRNAMWTALATSGYGLAIAAAASAAYYYKDVPGQISSTIYNNSKAIQALDKKTNQILTDAEKKLLETGKYVLDTTGNLVPNVSQAIKNADKAIADYLNPSYLTQAQQTWKNFNWDATTQGWKNFNFPSSNFTVDPMIESYQ